MPAGDPRSIAASQPLAIAASRPSVRDTADHRALHWRWAGQEEGDHQEQNAARQTASPISEILPRARWRSRRGGDEVPPADANPPGPPPPLVPPSAESRTADCPMIDGGNSRGGNRSGAVRRRVCRAAGRTVLPAACPRDRRHAGSAVRPNLGFARRHDHVDHRRPAPIGAVLASRTIMGDGSATGLQ